MKILKIAKEKAEERLKIESLLSYKVELITDMKTLQAEIDKIKRVENEEMCREYRELIKARKETYLNNVSEIDKTLKETDKILRNLMSGF
jgi:predicted lipase